MNTRNSAWYRGGYKGGWRAAFVLLTLPVAVLLSVRPAAADQNAAPKPSKPEPGKAAPTKAAPSKAEGDAANNLLRARTEAKKDAPKTVVVVPAPRISMQSGDAALRNGDLRGAADAYTLAAMAAPKEPMLRLPVGVTLAEMRLTSKAAEQFGKALVLADNDPLIALLYESALRDMGEAGQAQNLHMETYRRFALPGKNGLDVLPSITRLNSAIMQFPKCPIYHLLLGDAYQLAERFPEADAAYGKAIKLAPRWGKPLVNLGLSQLAQGKTGEAIRTFDAALRLDQGNKQARISREMGIGQQYAYNRDYPQAIISLRNAQSLAPKDPTPTLIIGDIERGNGNLEAAAKAYDTALNITRNGGLFTQRPILFRLLAETWLMAKQPGKAQEVLKRALDEEPGSAPEWYRLLARTATDMGQPDQAREMLKYAMDSEPGPYPADTLNAIDQEPGRMDALKSAYEGELAAASPGGVRTAPTSSGAVSITMAAPSRNRVGADRIRPLVALAHIARYRRDFREEVRLRRELTTLRNNPWDWYLMAETYDQQIIEPASAREAYLKALEINRLGGGLNEAAARSAHDRLEKLTPPVYKPE